MIRRYFSRLFQRFKEGYDYSRLVNQQILSEFDRPSDLEQIVSDIDKTYLETEFESIRKMVRIAFEKARHKKTVKGAADLFRVLRWTTPDPNIKADRPLHFVSSSPPQLRHTLRAKFALDGLEWHSDTFKNQAYNLLRVRVDQLRQHIAYKSAAILRLFARAPAGSRFYLIGDNVEFDAYIYVGVALFCQGSLSKNGYKQWLIHAGVDTLVAKDLVEEFEFNQSIQVSGIYIRTVSGYYLNTDFVLAKDICLFNNFFELSLYFVRDGLIGQYILNHFMRNFVNRHGLLREHIAESFDRVFGYKKLYSLDVDVFKREMIDISKGSIILPVSQKKKYLENAELDEEQILEQSKKWARTFMEEPIKK